MKNKIIFLSLIAVILLSLTLSVSADPDEQLYSCGNMMFGGSSAMVFGWVSGLLVVVVLILLMVLLLKQIQKK